MIWLEFGLAGSRGSHGSPMRIYIHTHTQIGYFESYPQGRYFTLSDTLKGVNYYT